MTTSVRNFVPCERVDDDAYFSLINVRFRWPEPPETIEFWLDILNFSEAELGVKLELYRGRGLVDFTEEEFVPPGFANVQAKFVLNTADLERKSYTVVAVVNGFAAGKLDLDFGANDG